MTDLTMSDVYDADRRRTDPQVATVAGVLHVPHPLTGVDYADGRRDCTHARRHDVGECSALYPGEMTR